MLLFWPLKNIFSTDLSALAGISLIDLWEKSSCQPTNLIEPESEYWSNLADIQSTGTQI